MAPEQSERLVVTASLTSGVARVTYGMRDSIDLINEILRLEHTTWETTLQIGDEEYLRSKDEGPFANHQMRISVSPSANYAALNYTDHDMQDSPIVNSYSTKRPVPEMDLIFNGATGTVFPRTALISVSDARNALTEWLTTRQLPMCIDWRPYDPH
ncbi:hypothetical protein DMH04_51940 [Kibdelosporangium aridum]|uniref:Immunity protein Imm1 n=1 Tax=Kibdelosporangium aridum TaxID=2030 RepID=A0A428Y907_KIBAR|nr:Imm1 family immunity protein [Kibdelosporangium aridum]RSM64103.1 hypothetical protein DMH04_51940 [Kibdelosporangium aridum]